MALSNRSTMGKLICSPREGVRWTPGAQEVWLELEVSRIDEGGRVLCGRRVGGVFVLSFYLVYYTTLSTRSMRGHVLNKLQLSRLCASGVILRRNYPLAVRKITGTKSGIAIDVTDRQCAAGLLSGKR